MTCEEPGSRRKARPSVLLCAGSARRSVAAAAAAVVPAAEAAAAAVPAQQQDDNDDPDAARAAEAVVAKHSMTSFLSGFNPSYDRRAQRVKLPADVCRRGFGHTLCPR